MIDTIRLRFKGPLLFNCAIPKEYPELFEWDHNPGLPPPDRRGPRVPWDRVRFRTSGAQFKVNDGVITECKASLPRLIWGHNGMPIRTRAELKVALDRLQFIMESITEPGPRGSTETVVQELHLNWQWADTDGLIRSSAQVGHFNRALSHPEVMEANGNSQIKGSKFKVTVYDKIREMKERSCQGCDIEASSAVTRIEFKLKKRSSNEELQAFTGIGEPDLFFELARHTYLDLLAELVLQPDNPPDIAGETKIVQALARQALHYRTMKPFEVFVDSGVFAGGTVSRWRKTIKELLAASSVQGKVQLLDSRGELPPLPEIHAGPIEGWFEHSWAKLEEAVQASGHLQEPGGFTDAKAGLWLLG